MNASWSSLTVSTILIALWEKSPSALRLLLLCFVSGSRGGTRLDQCILFPTWVITGELLFIPQHFTNTLRQGLLAAKQHGGTKTTWTIPSSFTRISRSASGLAPENITKGTSSLPGWGPLGVRSHPKAENQSRRKAQRTRDGWEKRAFNKRAITSLIKFPKIF